MFLSLMEVLLSSEKRIKQYSFINVVIAATGRESRDDESMTITLKNKSQNQ